MLKLGTVLALLVALAGVRAVRAQDTDGDGLVTFLVPINVPEATPGARATLWKSELWVHNGTSDRLTLRLCGIHVPPCEISQFHARGTTEMAFPRETTSNVGAILVTNIPAVFAGDVTLSSRLFELSRNTQPAGIHLPVVREDRFFTKPARFLSVESSSKLRTSLRVYDPRVQVGKTARVEFFASDGRPLGETNLTFTYGGASFEPGVAAVHDLTAAFPQLQSVDRYDIRVTADGAEYWALVSVTDNETQQVMLITAD